MRRVLARYREFYGSHPLQLLTMLAGFALLYAGRRQIKRRRGA